MENHENDTYRCQCSQGISQEAYNTLMIFYQPLLGSDATLVYLTMVSESQKGQRDASLQRMYSITSIPAASFVHACAKLEEYMLVRTYCKETPLKNQYIYVLNSPLSAKDFIENHFLMSRYVKVIGQTQAEVSKTIVYGGSVSLQGYKDITHPIKNLSNEDFDRSIDYKEVKPQYIFSLEDDSIFFDYERFLAKCTSLVFPIELRSQENMALIGHLATVYGLSPERMIILTKECVTLSTMQFDRDKMKIKAARAQSDTTVSEDPYSISPVSFLQSKQNGAPVSFSDRKIIEHLALDMHFNNAVINTMLEYILEVAQNRLVSNFVDKVATEWIRDGITTREQALLETKKQLQSIQNYRPRVKIDMPEYMKNPTENEGSEETFASDEQIKEITEMQQRIKERRNHGKD